MFRLRSHPEADAELDDQLAYLSRETLWQATKFADAFQAALVRIRTHPTHAHFIWKEFRRFNMPGFSHSLIYRSRNDEVFLIAVMHEKRHPDYWKNRIQDDLE